MRTDPGGPFSIRTIKYNISLTKFNGNKQFRCMLWRAHVGSTRNNFKHQGPNLGSRGPNLGPRGPSKVEWTKYDRFSFFGEGPTRPRGSPMANFIPVTGALAAPLSIALPELQIWSVWNNYCNSFQKTLRAPERQRPYFPLQICRATAGICIAHLTQKEGRTHWQYKIANRYRKATPMFSRHLSLTFRLKKKTRMSDRSDIADLATEFVLLSTSATHIKDACKQKPLPQYW